MIRLRRGREEPREEQAAAAPEACEFEHGLNVSAKNLARCYVHSRDFI